MEPVNDKQGKLNLAARIGKFFGFEMSYDGHITPAHLLEIRKIVLVVGLVLLCALVITFLFSAGF